MGHSHESRTRLFKNRLQGVRRLVGTAHLLSRYPFGSIVAYLHRVA
jgi:hypothetical protein